MKTMKRALLLLLVGCGVAWSLTGCGEKEKKVQPVAVPGKVNQSTKEAVVSSAFKAAKSNDAEGFLACFAPDEAKELDLKPQVERIMNKLRTDNDDEQVEITENFMNAGKQIDGKWYIAWGEAKNRLFDGLDHE